MVINLTDEIKTKLEIVLNNVNKIDFGERNIIPLVNTYRWESYEWDANFVGITKDGKIGYVFDSGCSCNDASWDADNNEIPDTVTETTLKGFELDLNDVYVWAEGFDLDDINSKLDEIIEVNKL
jgi:hypothetical protein